MTEGDRITELAELFLFLAEHDFAGYSPLYERIALTMAADRVLLEFVDAAAAPNSRRGRVPVLFHATLHEQALRHPDEPLGARVRRRCVDRSHVGHHRHDRDARRRDHSDHAHAFGADQ